MGSPAMHKSVTFQYQRDVSQFIQTGSRFTTGYCVCNTFFEKIGYSTSLVDNCFKLLLEKIHCNRPQSIKVDKQPLILVLPFLIFVITKNKRCSF